MNDMLRIEVPVKDGSMIVECTEEFLEIVRSRTGFTDEAAIRQFIHAAVVSAVQAKLQEQQDGR